MAPFYDSGKRPRGARKNACEKKFEKMKFPVAINSEMRYSTKELTGF